MGNWVILELKEYTVWLCKTCEFVTAQLMHQRREKCTCEDGS